MGEANINDLKITSAPGYVLRDLWLDGKLSQGEYMSELARRQDAAEKKAEALVAKNAEILRLRAALSYIAHTFTEDSHGNTKTYDASFYQIAAREALAGGSYAE